MSAKGARELWRSIEKGEARLPGEPDIVHSSSYHAPNPGVAKLVYTIHDLCFWTHPECADSHTHLLCQQQLLHALNKAAGFHFVSESTKADFEATFPNWLEQSRRPSIVAKSGIRLAPLLQTSPQDRWDNPQSPWLFVGTIEPRKNLDALLDTYLEYYKRSSTGRPLHLIGQIGWNAGQTLSRIDALSQDFPIKRLGYVSDEELRSEYDKSFATLLPSHHEGFGLTIVEAMANRLTPIVNKHPAASEFGENALRLADFSKACDVAQTMVDMETNQAKYLQQSEQSIEAALPYQWRRTARSLLAFYETLLHDEPKGENAAKL